MEQLNEGEQVFQVKLFVELVTLNIGHKAPAQQEVQEQIQLIFAVFLFFVA